MTGEELFEALGKMTPAERKRKIIATYWMNSDDSSGWEESKDIDYCRLTTRHLPHRGGKQVEVIELE